ncbi:hypothetical protein M758_4G143000 [Ceratodon purpureus]|nr:hypothetical protein M758_4G143000 [Ceratodon purpureus]
MWRSVWIFRIWCGERVMMSSFVSFGDPVVSVRDRGQWRRVRGFDICVCGVQGVEVRGDHRDSL